MQREPMKTYKQAFPGGQRYYLHNPMEPDPDGKGPGRYRYKYQYIWVALTPTGRQSKYYHAELSNKWRTSNVYPLPKLRPGYKWTGPYLYRIHETHADTPREDENE